MLVENNTTLEVFNDWTLRVHRPVQNPARLLLMLHGWTGNENSMWIFVRNFPEDYLLLAPRAPYSAPQGGWSWRQARPDSYARPGLDDLRESADALVRLVDDYSAREHIHASQFDVMGFSQGAALSNVLSCLYPNRIRKVGILAGFMPSGMDELISQKPLLGKQIFVSHGRQDKLVPLDRAVASMALLEQAGAQITFCEAEVGHRVASKCLRGLETYFTT